MGWPVQIDDFHFSFTSAALIEAVTAFLTFVMFRTYRAKRRTAQDNGKVQKFARLVSHNGIGRPSGTALSARLASAPESPRPSQRTATRSSNDEPGSHP